MNLVHVYRTYFPDPPGGIQEAIRQISLTTQPLHIDNTIFTLSPRPVPSIVDFPEGRVVRSKSWAAPASCDLGLFDAFCKYRSTIRRADILMHHFPWPFADVLRLFAGATPPLILLYHSDIVRQVLLGKVYSPLMARTLDAANAIVATSPNYAETSPILSKPSVRSKVKIIPLGINEDSYIKESDSEVFARMGLEDDEPYFLFIGVLRYYKGLDFLIEAARDLTVKVVIAGSGPEYDRLLNKKVELKVSNIIFAGHVTTQEKVALLKNCKAFVLPSHLRSEAFGVVLVEAALFGKPMISCEIGTGTSYINSHGITGFVISQNPNK
jgi:Glycosyltransferase